MKINDRMKMYESLYQQRAMPGLPMLARLDGRSFHKFTRGLERPFDDSLRTLMIKTTQSLVAQTDACCGYTQSDEITLVWLSESHKSEVFFAGKLFKVASVAAAMATAYFNHKLHCYLPEKAGQLPVFDGRAWCVPNEIEAVNTFIWREQDAVRNSILSAGQSVFSHREMHGKTCDAVQEMLHAEHGINWNDYPARHKRGTYVRRVEVDRPFNGAELNALPPKHDARSNPDIGVRRRVVQIEQPPRLTAIENKADFILRGADAKVLAEVAA